MNKIIIPTILLSLLSACSIMDISMQETAVPLNPDKFEVSLYEGLGLDLESMLREGSPESHLEGWFVTGSKFGVSLSPTADLTGRLYFSGYTVGGKLGPKLLVRQKGNNYLALAPALTALSSKGEAENNIYSSYGAELTFMSSWVLNPVMIPTLGARINYDYMVRHDAAEGAADTFSLVHGGVTGSLRFVAGPIMIHPEMGVEIAPMQGGFMKLFPTGSLGLGIQF